MRIQTVQVKELKLDKPYFETLNFEYTIFRYSINYKYLNK